MGRGTARGRGAARARGVRAGRGARSGARAGALQHEPHHGGAARDDIGTSGRHADPDRDTHPDRDADATWASMFTSAILGKPRRGSR